mmetsp:Transcript_38919/g.28176  ORF Transcript_38919/g.28176 Transcript_38919/m.28176 type:complete len:100 (-) Transcript_38919:518-817(-)
MLDWKYMPLFISYAMSLFEGNGVLLNLYSEHRNPKQFYPLLQSAVGLTTFLALVMSFMAYLCYGSFIQSIVIFNLPWHSWATLLVEVFYGFTIAGSFII